MFDVKIRLQPPSLQQQQQDISIRVTHSFRAQNKADVGVLLTLALAEKRPVSFTRVYAHPVTSAIEVSHAVCKVEF